VTWNSRPVSAGRVVFPEAFSDGVELASDGFTAQAAGPGGVPAAEQRDGLLKLGDLIGADVGRAAGQQRERGGPLAHRAEQCSPGDNGEAGQGLAPAGDVVCGETFHDPDRMGRRQREVQRDGGDQREAFPLAGHVGDIGQQFAQFLGGEP